MPTTCMAVNQTKRSSLTQTVFWYTRCTDVAIQLYDLFRRTGTTVFAHNLGGTMEPRTGGVQFPKCAWQ